MNNDNVYGAFLDFCGDIPMQMIRIEGDWVIYGTKVNSGLLMNRYIFAISPKMLQNPETTTLNQLNWVSLQTRTSDEVHSVPSIDLVLSEARKNAMNDELNVVNRTSVHTEYITTTLPIRIRLMLDPKRNNSLQYPDKLLLYKAFNTFNCVIDLL
jgi:hypothetical protein